MGHAGFAASALEVCEISGLVQFVTAETQKRGVRVGRAVHCATGIGCGASDFWFESCFPRPYGRGYGARPSRSKKAPDTLDPP